MLETNHTRSKFYLPINIQDNIDAYPIDKLADQLDIDPFIENYNIDSNFQSNNTSFMDNSKGNLELSAIKPHKHEQFIQGNSLIIRQITSECNQNILNRFVSDDDQTPRRGDLRISFQYKLIPPKLSIVGGLFDKQISFWNRDQMLEAKSLFDLKAQYNTLTINNFKQTRLGLYQTFYEKPYQDVLFVMPGMYRVDEMLYYYFGKGQQDYILGLSWRLVIVSTLMYFWIDIFMNWTEILQLNNTLNTRHMVCAVVLTILDFATVQAIQLFNFYYWKRGFILLGVELLMVFCLGVYLYLGVESEAGVVDLVNMV